MTETTEITLRRPDDWHVHLRDGAMLARVVPETARRFARAIVMPNLAPPVTTTAEAAAYRERIMAAVGPAAGFTPLMTCYLTDHTDAVDLARGFADEVVVAAKLYPAGATTNSADGVTEVAKISRVLEKMQAIGMPLLVHGEVADAEVDVFDREQVFIDRVLVPLVADFPELKVVLEHVTTVEGVAFVRAEAPRIAATITVHHLVLNRNAMFEGGFRPHRYCLPVAKREVHRVVLRQAATSGVGCFFLGTDSAPHEVADKETACGCAGIFTAPGALELYTQVFDEEGALDRLEAFASLNGPAFYGLPPNQATVRLVRESWPVPGTLEIDGGGSLRPFRAGQSVSWRLAE